MPRSREGRTALLALVAWLAIHLLFSNRLIFHDSWIHNFPLVYHAAVNGSCGVLPSWLFGVDGGHPLIIQAISTSITQLLRLPALFAMGCLQLSVLPALYVQKAQIYLTYLAFAGGMYVLGRVLYSERMAAVYLFVITLFAGLCLQTAHSDQTVNIVFWVPWIVCAAVLYLRTPDRKDAIKYINVAALFLCLQALDQYPHFVVLAAAVAAGLLILLRRDALSGWTTRLLLRLWPTVLIVLVTGIQLWLVRDSISDYRPSLRADLVVDPRKFGETGFTQPTAIIGAFFPLGFFAIFDDLATGLRMWFAARGLYQGASWFMYRLDNFFFYVGFLPCFTGIAFLMRPGFVAQRVGWAAFASIILLISLQQSGAYLVLFHLPFFEVFRSYALYLCYFLFAALVISGFGFDALLSLSIDARKRLMARALMCCLALGAAAAFLLASIVAVSPSRVDLLRRLIPPLLVDLSLLISSIWVIHRALKSRVSNERMASLFIIVIVVSQALYFTLSYSRAAISVTNALQRMGITRELAWQAPKKLGAQPVETTRRVCTIFAQCYLLPSETTSLSTDLQGTFLRSREAPLYQPGLALPVIVTLSAITHPGFWMSKEVEPYDDKLEAIARLNRQQDRIGEFLREKTQVPRHDVLRGAFPQSGDAIASTEGNIARSRDAISIAYHSTRPAYLNAAITFDPRWQASVEHSRVPIAKGNLDGLVLAVPAGARTVRLEYRNFASDVFVYSRYAMLLLACWAVARILRDGRRTGIRNSAADGQRV